MKTKGDCKWQDEIKIQLTIKEMKSPHPERERERDSSSK